MTSTTLESIAQAAPDRQPFWGIALLFPDQGTWSEEEYLDLTGNHFIEFTEGHLELLPRPSPYHQVVAANIHRLLREHVKPRSLGAVFLAPVPVQVALGKYREPDIAFVSAAKLPADIRQVKKLDAADLVVEVVSPGSESRERDLIHKRQEYAAAGIQEYWIVHPDQSEVQVLSLQKSEYVAFGTFRPRNQLRSRLLPDMGARRDYVL